VLATFFYKFGVKSKPYRKIKLEGYPLTHLTHTQFCPISLASNIFSKKWFSLSYFSGIKKLAV
jgi:hypothetical protein